MSAMEELRRLLDERGVECYQRYVKYGHSVGWTGSNGYLASAEEWGGALLVQAILTPEQAVDATMGRKTCRMTLCAAGNDYARYRCSECEQETMTPRVLVEGVSCGYERPTYCVNCGRKVV